MGPGSSCPHLDAQIYADYFDLERRLRESSVDYIPCNGIANYASNSNVEAILPENYQNKN